MLSEEAGLRAMDCSNPHFPDEKTEAQGGDAIVQGHTALGQNPSLLPGAHSGTQLPSSHSFLPSPRIYMASLELLPRHREQEWFSGIS